MTGCAFPIEAVRAEFPSLSIRDGGEARVYLDNPAGTQVPLSVARAASRALLEFNANLGGFFRTSVAAEEAVRTAHEAMAVFLNAQTYREVLVAQSMTNLTFNLSRSLGRTMKAGDEIVLTRMDHDGNVAPWLMLAEERGLAVRWVDFNRESWVIEPQDLERVLGPRTRLVALNYASNLTGSVNDVAALTALAKTSGALVYVDAVQFAPHGSLDVQSLGCDFLACSSYKFYGPHLGIVWGREEILNGLTAYKPRPQTEDLPWKFETGTPQIEMLAALTACVEYVGKVGTMLGATGSLRSRICRAFDALRVWEDALSATLIAGLRNRNAFSIYGLSGPQLLGRRVPTVSFTKRGSTAAAIAQHLARKNIFVWSGNNFALEVVRALGLPEDDGVLRIGLAHYNTPGEVLAVLEALP